MNSHDLRQMEPEDLEAKVEAIREDLFKLRFQHATAQLSNPNEIRKTRRSLARALTLLRERQSGIEKNANPQQPAMDAPLNEG
jgi:large subunit ribosomal protein L29